MGTIGNLGTSVAEPVTEAPKKKRKSLGFGKILVAVLAGGVLGSVAGTGISVFTKLQANAYDFQATLFPQSPQDTASKLPEKLSPEIMNAYIWSLRIRLDDLGLGQILKVESVDDTSIMITGKLPGDLNGRYELFKGWVAAQPNYPPFLDQVNVLEVSGEFPNIVAVWLGDLPKLQLEDGREAGIGEKLDADWTIVRITALAVTLERDDGMVIELSYDHG